MVRMAKYCAKIDRMIMASETRCEMVALSEALEWASFLSPSDIVSNRNHLKSLARLVLVMDFAAGFFDADQKSALLKICRKCEHCGRPTYFPLCCDECGIWICLDCEVEIPTFSFSQRVCPSCAPISQEVMDIVK